MKTIVLTGGGTGGHVIPALALVPHLKKHFDRILFIGSNGIEKRLAEEAGLPFFSVRCVKLERTRIFANAKIPFLLFQGIKDCEKIFERENPDVVFSKGGYVSLPACFAAKKKGVPLVIHESDYTMGVANRIASRFAAKTLSSFSSVPGAVCTGNPVREEIFNGNREKALKKYLLRPGKKIVLFCGGSQGADAINKAVYNALPELTKKYNILHVAGKSGDFSIKNTDVYHQIEFANDFPDLLAAADIVVGRAGANTLFEVASVGKPMLCIPLPKGVSRGDQLLNAEEFRKNGFVDILPQEDLFTESLLYKIESTLKSKPAPLDSAQTCEKIVREILSVAK